MTAHGVLVKLHRYAGLLIAAFLTVAGLTGSVLAFQRELDSWLNPALFHVAPGPPMSPDEIARRVADADARVRPAFIEVNVAPGQSTLVWIEPQYDATGQMAEVGYNQVFVDPSNGTILGHRDYGACCFARENLIPFLYDVHRRLAMPGHWGDWLMGGVAVLWTLDCFIALALTFPRRAPVLARWTTAWKIKTGASSFRVIFDLHRAGGLWLWIVLLAVAMSSVYLNLGDEVFRPVVGVFSPLTPPPQERPKASSAAPRERLSFDEILVAATRLASVHGWPYAVSGIYDDRDGGLYIVDFGKGGESPLGTPWAAFDATTGAAVTIQAPGKGSLGDQFLMLQFPLHSGQIAGLPGRIAICLTGVAVAVLSITGLIIWWRKRRSRRAHLRSRTGTGAGGPGIAAAKTKKAPQRSRLGPFQSPLP
jgi:uncharacterized iron-regulated membrane protein